eukprot:gene60460-82729_t
MERVKGIEPSYEAWEAAVLPLNYTRILAFILMGNLVRVAAASGRKRRPVTGPHADLLAATIAWVPMARTIPMSDASWHVLHTGPAPAVAAWAGTGGLVDGDGFGPFDVASCAADDLWPRIAAAPADVLVIHGGWDGWVRCASDVAVIIVADAPTAADCVRWLRDGAQDI